MTIESFQHQLTIQQATIQAIMQSAFDLHDGVNQIYGGIHPYGYHLQMVAENVMKYGHSVCVDPADVPLLIFGAYYHDSIEDARLTYHDVARAAQRYMDESQAVCAAEIVYAVTNEKGRTRAERADERYYQGIRETPYAPFVKLADRLANAAYSMSSHDEGNLHMREVYRGELPHFLNSLTVHTPDVRFLLPSEMVVAIQKLIG